MVKRILTKRINLNILINPVFIQRLLQYVFAYLNPNDDFFMAKHNSNLAFTRYNTHYDNYLHKYIKLRNDLYYAL